MALGKQAPCFFLTSKYGIVSQEQAFPGMMISSLAKRKGRRTQQWRSTNAAYATIFTTKQQAEKRFQKWTIVPYAEKKLNIFPL